MSPRTKALKTKEWLDVSFLILFIPPGKQWGWERGEGSGLVPSSLGTRSYHRIPTTPRAEMRTTVHFDIHYPKKRVDDEDLSLKMQLL